MNIFTQRFVPYFYGAVSCLLGLYVCDFSLGFGSMTFGHLADAAQWSNGLNIQKTTSFFPVGYPVLLSLFGLFGLNPFLAGLAINLLSHFGIVVILTSIKTKAPIWIKRLFIASIILSPMPLAHMTFVWVEAPFTFFSLLAFVQVNHMVKRQIEHQKSSFSQLIVLAVTCAIPFYMRYLGVFVPVSAAIVILLFALRYKGLKGCFETFGEYLIASLLLVSFIAPQLVKNYFIHGDIFGHPVNAAPAYDFVTAIKVTLSHVGDFLFGNMAFYQISQKEGIRSLISSFGVTIPVLASILIFLRIWKFKIAAIAAIFMLTYVLLFGIAQSTTRLDLIVYRFVHPLWPVALIMLIGVWEQSDLSGKIRWKSIYLNAVKLLAFSSMMLILALGIYRGTHQLENVSTFNYSPELLDHINKNLDANSVVLVNRFGDQIRAIRPDIEVHMIPFSDPNNGNYQEVYGVSHWNENQFRDLKNKLDFNQIIMFMGSTNTDPFLENGWYGDYMSALIYSSAKTFTSMDGFIIEIE